MNTDRRTSLRTTARLPFEWCSLTATLPVEALREQFGIGRELAMQDRLASLSAEFQQLVAEVRDSRTANSLRVLDARLDCIAAFAAAGPLPAITDLELSAEGLGFVHESVLPRSALLGVHLVLPENYHLVCHAEISHASSVDEGIHHGTRLIDLPPVAARRLARFVMAMDRAKHE